MPKDRRERIESLINEHPKDFGLNIADVSSVDCKYAGSSDTHLRDILRDDAGRRKLFSYSDRDSLKYIYNAPDPTETFNNQALDMIKGLHRIGYHPMARVFSREWGKLRPKRDDSTETARVKRKEISRLFAQIHQVYHTSMQTREGWRLIKEEGLENYSLSISYSSRKGTEELSATFHSNGLIEINDALGKPRAIFVSDDSSLSGAEREKIENELRSIRHAIESETEYLEKFRSYVDRISGIIRGLQDIRELFIDHKERFTFRLEAISKEFAGSRLEARKEIREHLDSAVASIDGEDAQKAISELSRASAMIDDEIVRVGGIVDNLRKQLKAFDPRQESQSSQFATHSSNLGHGPQAPKPQNLPTIAGPSFSIESFENTAIIPEPITTDEATLITVKRMNSGVKSQAGRWPFMQAKYDWIETKMQALGMLSLGRFVGQALIPGLLESGAFLGVGSFILHQIFQSSMHAYAPPIWLTYLMMNLAWEQLHGPTRFSPAAKKITIGHIIWMVACNILDIQPTLSTLPILSIGLIIPHVIIDALIPSLSHSEKSTGIAAPHSDQGFQPIGTIPTATIPPEAAGQIEIPELIRRVLRADTPDKISTRVLEALSEIELGNMTFTEFAQALFDASQAEARADAVQVAATLKQGSESEHNPAYLRIFEVAYLLKSQGVWRDLRRLFNEKGWDIESIRADDGTLTFSTHLIRNTREYPDKNTEEAKNEKQAETASEKTDPAALKTETTPGSPAWIEGNRVRIKVDDKLVANWTGRPLGTDAVADVNISEFVAGYLKRMVSARDNPEEMRRIADNLISFSSIRQSDFYAKDVENIFISLFCNDQDALLCLMKALTGWQELNTGRSPLLISIWRRFVYDKLECARIPTSGSETAEEAMQWLDYFERVLYILCMQYEKKAYYTIGDGKTSSTYFDSFFTHNLATVLEYFKDSLEGKAKSEIVGLPARLNSLKTNFRLQQKFLDVEASRIDPGHKGDETDPLSSYSALSNYFSWHMFNDEGEEKRLGIFKQGMAEMELALGHLEAFVTKSSKPAAVPESETGIGVEPVKSIGQEPATLSMDKRVIPISQYSLEPHISRAVQIEEAAQSVYDAAMRHGYTSVDCDNLKLLARQLASNILIWGGGGILTVNRIEKSDGTIAIELVGIDRGPGIDDAKKLEADSVPGIKAAFWAYSHLTDEAIVESRGKAWKQNWNDFVETGPSEITAGTQIHLTVYRRNLNREDIKIRDVELAPPASKIPRNIEGLAELVKGGYSSEAISVIREQGEAAILLLLNEYEATQDRLYKGRIISLLLREGSLDSEKADIAQKVFDATLNFIVTAETKIDLYGFMAQLKWPVTVNRLRLLEDALEKAERYDVRLLIADWLLDHSHLSAVIVDRIIKAAEDVYPNSDYALLIIAKARQYKAGGRQSVATLMQGLQKTAAKRLHEIVLEMRDKIVPQQYPDTVYRRFLILKRVLTEPMFAAMKGVFNAVSTYGKDFSGIGILPRETYRLNGFKIVEAEDHDAILAVMETEGIKGAVLVNFDMHADSVIEGGNVPEGHWGTVADGEGMTNSNLHVMSPEYLNRNRDNLLNLVKTVNGPLVISICYDYFQCSKDCPVHECYCARAAIKDIIDFIKVCDKPVRLVFLADSSKWVNKKLHGKPRRFYTTEFIIWLSERIVDAFIGLSAESREDSVSSVRQVQDEPFIALKVNGQPHKVPKAIFDSIDIARIKDAPSIKALSDTLSRNENARKSVQYYERAIAGSTRGKNSYIFVYRSQGEVKGYVYGMPDSLDGYFNIAEIAVDEGSWNQKIGETLVTVLIDHALKEGNATRFKCDTTADYVGRIAGRLGGVRIMSYGGKTGLYRGSIPPAAAPDEVTAERGAIPEGDTPVAAQDVPQAPASAAVVTDAVNLGEPAVAPEESGDAEIARNVHNDEMAVSLETENGGDEMKEFIFTMHQFARKQFTEQSLDDSPRKILIAEELFNSEDAAISLRAVLNKAHIEILPAKDIRARATNAKESKNKLACVLGRKEFGALWNESHAVNNKSTVIVLDDDFKGEHYLFLEAMIGFAYAAMNEDEMRIRVYANILFEDADPGEVITRLKSSDLKEQLTGIILKFKAVTPDGEKMGDYKMMMEEYLRAA